MSDKEAFETFKNIRWFNTGGNPICPRCNCAAVYQYKARQIFKCKGCDKQFSVTTGTIFASRKLALRDILAAMQGICSNPAFIELSYENIASQSYLQSNSMMQERNNQNK